MRWLLLPTVVVIPVSLVLGPTERAALPPAFPEGPAQGQAMDVSAAACGKCHKKIYEQWKQSLHSQAWTSEVYQAWTKTKSKPQSCYRCHIPMSVIPGAPKRPAARKTHLDEGVGCASCHVHAGQVWGPHGLQCKHPTKKSKLHREGIQLCQSCHRVTPKPVISIGKDFEKAGLAAKGKSCTGCHMPEYEDHVAWDPNTGEPVGKKRKLLSHRFQGRTNPEQIAKAFEFHRHEKGGKLTLRLENKAGHRLPGLTLRSYTVKFEVVDGTGKVVASQDAVISADKRQFLMLGESRTAEFPAPAKPFKARVTVRHHWKKMKKDKPQETGVVFKAEK